MLISCPELMIQNRDLNTVAALIKDLGFDGIDCRFSSLADTAFTDELRRLELPIASVYSQLHTPSLLGATAAERAAAVEEVIHRATVAAEFGAANLIVVPIFGEPLLPLSLPKSEFDEIEYAHLIVLFQEIGERLRDIDIKVVVEPLNRNETHLLTNPTFAAALCDRIGESSITTMVDTYHCFEEGQDPAEEIRQIGNHLQLIHASDSSRGLPGEGSVDFSAVSHTLKEVGYEGWVGLECRSIETEDDVRALGASLEFLRMLG